MVYIPGRNSAVSVARCLALAIALSVASATASAQPAGISLQLAYEVEWGNVDVATATADWVFSEDGSSLSRRPGPSD